MSKKLEDIFQTFNDRLEGLSEAKDLLEVEIERMKAEMLQLFKKLND